MKKRIVIGSILTVSILMILPSVSAVEFSTAVESNKAQILEQIQSMNIDELREKIKILDFQELKEKIKDIQSTGFIIQALLYILTYYLSWFVYSLPYLISYISLILIAGPIRFLLTNIFY